MSRNSEIMSLELSRLDMCDLMSATLSVYFDMDEEMRDKKTREDRKEVLAESMKKWERLHEEIKRQINAFDREYNERHSKGGIDMTIWIEDRGRQFFGHEWIISSERHDGISYTADSVEEAIDKYEKDRRCVAKKVILDGREYTKI